MKLSIVATLYQSERHVDEFCDRAAAAARQVAVGDYEIVLVNDGSPDGSLDRAVARSRGDGHVVVVDLSRNFGHHKAMMSGLAHARGELVFLIDSDLEEEPEWLIPFERQMKRDLCDVVFGVQERRKGGLVERWSGFVFYKLLRALTGLSIPDNIVVARLMTRRYLDALLSHREREVFVAGLWTITGFDQRPQAVRKHDKGESSYTLRRKFAQLVDSVTSFSSAPLVGIFYIGLLISLLSGTYAIYLAVHWLFLAIPPGGWTSLITSIWLLGGLSILFIGVVGIYVAKVFSETKGRPNTIVRCVYGRDGEGR